jgi:hypothetical protein
VIGASTELVTVGLDVRDAVCPGFDAPAVALEPCSSGELRALVLGGQNESDVCEGVLAQVARIEGALEVAIGEGLAALTVGERLISLGFSSLRDYAREILGLGERKAQAMAHLARELRSRPLLRAAVRAGEVRIRSAETVLPVACGEAEAAWVDRARGETVRALASAVREARGSAQDDDDAWSRLHLRLAPDERAVVDEALELAGALVPGSTRAQRLEAMAQEYLAEHSVEAGSDTPGAGGAFGRGHEASARARAERREAKLEHETERWSYLPAPGDVRTPDVSFDDATSAAEIDRALRALAARRDAWDALLGWAAYSVRRTGLWRLAGFDSFAHYCAERLGLSARTVEQRAALEKRLWLVPELRAARDAGLSYEKLRLLSRLPAAEVAAWLPKARALTCIALRDALDDREDTQLRAASLLRARVPARVAELLASAFRAARAASGCALPDGKCLVLVAAHFADTWRAHVKRPRTASQKVRARDQGRCQVPGCSRRAALHAHHVHARAQGGSDDAGNQVALCPCHHLRGVHGGWLRVRGTAPDRLVWEVGGRVFTGGP